MDHKIINSQSGLRSLCISEIDILEIQSELLIL